MAHYSDAFSPDPDEFRPERWLESDKEKLNEMNRAHMPVSTNTIPGVPQLLKTVVWNGTSDLPRSTHSDHGNEQDDPAAAQEI